MECILFQNEKKYIKDFLSLPNKLYGKRNITEDSASVKELLLGKHILNKYFSLNKFIIYKDGKAVGRFVITEYPEDKKTCYLGFFECVNDNKIAKFLFDEAYRFAKDKNYKKIVGPVDASFWYKYRLKVNKYDRPYTGEPYNLDYYYTMFLKNHFYVTDHYTSQIYEQVDSSYSNDEFQKHYKEFTRMGYQIIKPSLDDFEKCMEEVYDLIMTLYADFPMFRPIEKEDFLNLFLSFKKVIHMDMVRMAYYKEKAVGFYISIPNYYNLVYKPSLMNLLHILKIKKKPKNYVMLYMGVDQKHRGLGQAMIYSIVQELKKSQASSIGALVHDGKVTQNYAKEKISSRYEYVLLERKVQ